MSAQVQTVQENHYQEKRDRPPQQPVRNQYQRKRRILQRVEQFPEMVYGRQLSDYPARLYPELAGWVFSARLVCQRVFSVDNCASLPVYTKRRDAVIRHVRGNSRIKPLSDRVKSA